MNPGEETMKKNADAMAEAVIIIIIASWGATFLILFGELSHLHTKKT